jgi:anti-sigma factor RsiW
MKCPNRDEWVPYVFGEATTEARQRLGAHLQSCPQCEAEVAGWQRSLQKLDRWKLPEPEARMETARPVLRWALAALVVLSAGFGLGRVFAPADSQSFRARVEASVKASLVGELQSALERLQVQSSNAIASAELRLAKASEAEMGRLARGLIEAMNNGRQEDRQSTQALLETFGRQFDSQLISMRTDLETVASLAEDEIRQAQTKLFQIAAGGSANP